MNNEARIVLDSIRREIEDDYNRIQLNAIKDPGSAGDKGEEIWKIFLESWLPTEFKIVTKGNIILKNGEISPQIDILVINPSYPPKLLEKKIYYIDGVVAAFECKLTLKSKHIANALRTSKILKENSLKKEGTPYSELNSNIIYGLLAQSHSWKNKNSTPVRNIENNLIKNDKKFIFHPREMIDVICVADLATWVASKISVIIPKNQFIQNLPSILSTGYVQFSNEIIKTNGMKQNINPLCSLLYFLTKKLAKNFVSLRCILNIYNSINFLDDGHGQTRIWDSNEVFSQELKSKIKNGQAHSSDAWDDWNPLYI